MSFNIICSYKPPMMAIVVQDINRSYGLIVYAEEFVLAVPGEEMAGEAMECGFFTSRDADKMSSQGIELIASDVVK